MSKKCDGCEYSHKIPGCKYFRYCDFPVGSCYNGALNKSKLKPDKSNAEKIAEMLGVEIGESFNVIGRGLGWNPHYFSKEGKLIDCGGLTRSDRFLGIISGEYTIEKLPPEPWKPKVGERYNTILGSGAILNSVWSGHSIDYYRFNAGNCFKTKEEITPEIIERILKEMKGKYENGN